mmetsp:Transcript_22599/g.30955  ORF Transcript_22599/g.30955 Transcript_22599/m.30955 type:complete len:133 (+) Transcript_22599:196-594(+)
MNSIILFFVAAFLIVQIDAFTTSRIVNKNIVTLNAIPPFNWPGSIIPPSNLESLFGGSGSGSVSSSSSVKTVKSSSPVVSKATSAPAAKKPASKGKEPKKDMTWGGRPDPAPEMYVDENAGFLGSKWRFGKK